MSNENVISSDTFFEVSIILFNNIAIPCIATMIVSPNCFYFCFIPPPNVTVEFNFSGCSNFQTQSDGTVECVEVNEQTSTTSYEPPFLYSYQCSSSFISNYASIYVYMFLIIAILRPLFSVLSLKLYCRLFNEKEISKDGFLESIYDSESSIEPEKKKQNYFERFIDFFVPLLLKPSLLNKCTNRIEQLFDKTAFTIRLITDIAVILTFGVIFPPLAVLGYFSIFSYTGFYQLNISRLFSI
jgi:hypothetical protein